MFQTIFKETIHAFRLGPELADELWDDIAFRYSGADRHYHNLHHLDALVSELSAVKGAINNWDIVVFSIAYHDIIYNTLKKDNEAQSAGYAQKMLSPILSATHMQQCSETILATQSHLWSSNPDINYFTDADLSILGAPPERYRLYTEQIRSEYSYYPDLLYRPGRQKVLRHFHSIERIFKTDAFYEKYEQQARRNIAAELALLSA